MYVYSSILPLLFNVRNKEESQEGDQQLLNSNIAAADIINLALEREFWYTFKIITKSSCRA